MEEKRSLKFDALALARMAGLERAASEFPDDVLNAAQAAAQDLEDMPLIDGTQEPWPPMRVRVR